MARTPLSCRSRQRACVRYDFMTSTAGRRQAVPVCEATTGLRTGLCVNHLNVEVGEAIPCSDEQGKLHKRKFGGQWLRRVRHKKC